MPILKPSTSLTILSDLHLSTGPYLASGSPDPLEQFFADQAFAHFLEYLIGSLSRENQPGRLLFLGDFLDFLHARLEPIREKHVLDIDTSETTAHQKLERIFAGHPVFFEALGRLAAAGFHIDLVPGNHDIDLMRPAIQSHFTDLLAKAGRQAEIASKVHFFAWLYTIPGLLYAEHGNQYHDLNSFPTLLSPYHPSRPDALELPLGSYFDIFFHHLVERVGAPEQGIRSPILYLARKYIRHPANLILAFPDVFWFAWRMLQIIAYWASPGCEARRKAYQTGVLAEYAAGLDLSIKTVLSLDRLCAAPDARMLLRLIRKLLPPGGQPLLHGGYLFQAARSIHQLLQAEGCPVPFYVFGHSHQATGLPLPSGDGIGPGPSACFLNTGTWSEAPFSSAGRTRNTFPFIQIVKELNAQGPTARLFQWNESLKLAEQLS